MGVTDQTVLRTTLCLDTDVYKALGESNESEMQNSLHSTLEDLSPIPGNINMAVRSMSDISTRSSLKAVFHDLVELDQIFAQQVQEAEAQRSPLDDYVNCLTTAQSFSDTILTTAYGLCNRLSFSVQCSCFRIQIRIGGSYGTDEDVFCVWAIGVSGWKEDQHRVLEELDEEKEEVNVYPNPFLV